MPAPSPLPVLIVDDNPGIRTALQVLLDIHDIPCLTADGPEGALTIARSRPLGLVIQDMNFTEATTSGEEGVRLFHALRDLDAELPVVLITAWASLETAVELVKAGAADYLSKPWDDERLVARVRRLLSTRAGRLAVAGASPQSGGVSAARAALAERFDLCGLIYESEAMHNVVSLAVKVAAADVPVLITGPNGAGKEKLAEIIQANSSRASSPFVRVNAGALPDTLIESELFGVEAGAYTGASKRRAGRFEVADRGTLFLDEIGNLPLSGQAKLLRVLQTGAYERVGSSTTRTCDVRLISATNVDLPRAISEGRFRQDLYFRLNVIEIPAPPLSARRADIVPLARHFASLLTTAGQTTPRLDPSAVAALEAHPWPGNVRELHNTMQRALLLCQGEVIRAEDLALGPALLTGEQPAISAPAFVPVVPTAPVPGEPVDPERQAIEAALDAAGGVVSKAAEQLGLSRQALYRRMDRHGISIERRTTRGSR